MVFQQWLDQLQPASVNSIPVHIDSVRGTGGPQVVVRNTRFRIFRHFTTWG